MTPTEITAHAIELGITKEAFPELWDCGCATCDMASDVCYCGLSDYSPVWHCNIPAPDSTDPRCPLWDGFYMRALGWPVILYWTDGFNVKKRGLDESIVYPTPTAALRAAWLAKGAKA